MAKEVITRCDAAFTLRTVKDCGEAHEDTRTFRISSDGQAWEIDLGGEHAEALLAIARKGREVANLGRLRDPNRGMEQRIRNVPGKKD